MADPVELRNLSFLHIEDNNFMRTLVRTILQGFGVRSVYEAADGADGLEVLAERDPDIVICDWVMTPVDGAEFLRLIRGSGDPGLVQKPVIMLSAHTQKANVLEAMRLGSTEYLAKPISPKSLYLRINRVLANPKTVINPKPLPDDDPASENEATDVAPHPAPEQQMVEPENSPDNTDDEFAML
ncbi:MAG: response regulator [Stappiaceae bacterium]